MQSVFELSTALDFLAHLALNNNREWFGAHKNEFERAKGQFESFVDAVIGQVSAFEALGATKASDCTMRVYRDVRFSLDKTPYKTNFGASIAVGGRKSSQMGYFVHLAPHDQSLVATGLWDPGPEVLAKFRSHIVKDAAPFRAIISNPTFRNAIGEISGDQLVTAPKGYGRDHPEIDLLRRKQILAVKPVGDSILLGPDAVELFVTAILAMKPFKDYLNRLLESSDPAG